jgi:hypothetical protein
MKHELDLRAIVRTIIDSNTYVTLATADEHGRPWASPVYYTSVGYKEFYWVSSPQVTHSLNLAKRPELSMVVFNSQVPPGTGQAVYMAAVAKELRGVELDTGVDIYSRGAEARGAWRWDPENVRPPAPYRLYRATVREHSILCPRNSGQPCPVHGQAFDHRIAVTLSAHAE